MDKTNVCQMSDVRPPNPYDFSSLCEFLEKIFKIDGFESEYEKIIPIIESHINQSIENNTHKEKLRIEIHSGEQFELAFIRALFGLSFSLITFKQLSPQEQDVRREFISKDNYGSIENALTSAGFPEAFGKTLLKQNVEALKSFNLPKALGKIDSVFNRAFYFQIKDTELSKKSIDELLDGIRQFTETEDLKQYLETLLYKVEVSSTEKTFESMKRKISEPLGIILSDVIERIHELEEDPMSAVKDGQEEQLIKGQLENKAKILQEYCQQYFNLMQGKAEIITDFHSQYFSSEDFIFVEKNLLQFKKVRAEQQDKNSKPMLSDDFMANVESKLMIQLISALKKVYNVDELWFLKCYILHDLVDQTESTDSKDAFVMKYSIKKKILLESLKRIRLDMLFEDTYTTATENKKTFLEEFEKNLLQLSPEQLESKILAPAFNKSQELMLKATRMLAKKKKRVEEDKNAEVEFKKEVSNSGVRAASIILELYKYKKGMTQEKVFQKYLPYIENETKTLESHIKKMGTSEKQDDRKVYLQKFFKSFFEGTKELKGVDSAQDRMYQVYMKSFIDRIHYW